MEVDPRSAGWVTCVVWDVDRGVSVGRAGFHGLPDDGGMVEVGYAIAPLPRRRGYARAALGALLERAERESGVRTVRASISEHNVASLALVRQFGVVETGEQWDDEDGVETIFEVERARVTIDR